MLGRQQQSRSDPGEPQPHQSRPLNIPVEHINAGQKEERYPHIRSHQRRVSQQIWVKYD